MKDEVFHFAFSNVSIFAEGKDSARREKNQIYLCFSEPQPIFAEGRDTIK